MTDNNPPQRRQIPGPAGRLNEARRRMERGKMPMGEGSNMSTQEYMDAEDKRMDLNSEFSQDVWDYAVEKCQEDLEAIARQNGVAPQLETVADILKSKDKRVGKTVVMISKLTNTSGWNYQAELQDHTGKIKASIHQSVCHEVEYGYHLKVGTCLILKGVSLFKVPFHTPIMNITGNNVSRIFLKELPPVNLDED